MDLMIKEVLNELGKHYPNNSFQMKVEMARVEALLRISAELDTIESDLCTIAERNIG